jgi:haloalkane dehalogenase
MAEADGWRAAKRFAQVLGRRMAYVESGAGRPTLTGAVRDFCRTWPDQAEVTVPGIHFIQEDSGAEIGRAIAAWLRQLPATAGDG